MTELADEPLTKMLAMVLTAVEDCIFYNRFVIPAVEKGTIVSCLMPIGMATGTVDRNLVRALCFEASERASRQETPKTNGPGEREGRI